ncbi:MAG: sulfotransferase, partial [Thermoanaerobaculia bacterium]|nr:sulfotransferase [Thermoanaerobaculia bacterium]
MGEWAFDARTLIETARQKTGLSDFGGGDLEEGLAVLLETYDAHLVPDAAVRKAAWKRVEKLLELRLRIAAALARHPEVRDLEIARPLFLTGLPRTGTSALFNLLGMDPAARPLLLWESFFPEPLEGLPPGAPDPRREAMRQRNAQSRYKNAEFEKIHHTDADTPEECVLLMAATFQHVHNGIEILTEP